MIKLRNISKYYSKNQTVSLGLRKINLDLGLNEFVAIVGESGSGKTTLLNVISGIDSYEEGEMYKRHLIFQVRIGRIIAKNILHLSSKTII